MGPTVCHVLGASTPIAGAAFGALSALKMPGLRLLVSYNSPVQSIHSNTEQHFLHSLFTDPGSQVFVW